MEEKYGALLSGLEILLEEAQRSGFEMPCHFDAVNEGAIRVLTVTQILP